MHVYFVTTQNCNYKCKHCYMYGQPGRLENTISSSDFEKVMNNLPREEELNLTLTGGEIFTNPNLWDYLDIIEKEEIKKMSQINVNLQTNGFWGKSPENIIRKLNEYSINILEISSHDIFHEEQGHEKDWNYNLKSKLDSIIPTKITGGSFVAHGRAKNNSIERNAPFCYLTCRNRDFEYLSINFNGEVSTCCFGLFKLEGNIIEESFETIIDYAKKDPVRKTLFEDGLSGVAKYFGMKEEDIWRKRSLFGTTQSCACLFNEGIIPEKYQVKFPE